MCTNDATSSAKHSKVSVLIPVPSPQHTYLLFKKTFAAVKNAVDNAVKGWRPPTPSVAAPHGSLTFLLSFQKNVTAVETPVEKAAQGRPAYPVLSITGLLKSLGKNPQRSRRRSRKRPEVCVLFLPPRRLAEIAWEKNPQRSRRRP